MKKTALLGSAWTVGGQGAQQAFRLASNIVLTRLLWPEAFGLVSLVNVFLNGLRTFADAGFRGSVIYSKRGDDPEFLNTTWTLNVLRGFLLFVLCFAGAWPLAAFYDEPQLRWLVLVGGFIMILEGFRSVSLWTHGRHLRLGRLALVELASQFIGIVAMIVLAWLYSSVWALICGGLVRAGMILLLSHTAVSTIRTRFYFNKEDFRELFHFGKWVFISTLAMFLAAKLDRLLLGKLLSFKVLGIYTIALTFAMIPVKLMRKLTAQVAQPLFARKAREHHEEFVRSVHRARRIVLPVGLCASLCVGLLSPPFFRYLYDERYWAAGWMGQLLSISVWFMILRTSADRALLAIGHSRAAAAVNVVGAVVTCVSCVVGFYVAGIVGVIWGTVLGNLSGHVTLQVLLGARRISVWKTDLLYTAAFGAILLLGVLAPRAIAGKEQAAASAAGIVLAALLLLSTALWTAGRVLGETRAGGHVLARH